MGLGALGEPVARALAGFGFDVSGWARRPREIEGGVKAHLHFGDAGQPFDEAYDLVARRDVLPAAVFGQTLDGVITNWNPSSERLFGYTAAEAIGQPVMMLIPPDRREERARANRARRAGWRGAGELVSNRRADGRR